VTTEDSALREIDQAIAEEQQSEFLKKYAPLLIGGASAVVLGVGGWQFYLNGRNANAAKAAADFKSATETLIKSPEEGRLALEAFSADAPDGYAVIADLRRAASLGEAGDRAGALALLREIYAGKAPKRLKELARLRAAVLALADGRDAVLSDLGGLIEGEGAFGHHARELANVAALQARDYEAAYSGFKAASEDLAAPEPVRQRAAEFAALAASGRAGVNLTGETRIEDLTKALGAGGEEAAPPAEDAGAGQSHEDQ
jgi:hypothetical protein